MNFHKIAIFSLSTCEISIKLDIILKKINKNDNFSYVLIIWFVHMFLINYEGHIKLMYFSTVLLPNLWILNYSK